MKNVMKMLLVSAALVVALPAWAAPGLAGSATPIEQGTIGLTSPSTPTQIAIALKRQSNYAAKDYSLPEIEAVLRSTNGWNSNQVIPLNYRFSIPLPVEAPAAKPEPVVVTKEEAPVAQAAAKPLVEPSPELRAVRTELATVRRQKAEMAPRLKSVAALPVAALTSDERAMLKTAATLEKRIATLEPLEARMTAAEAVNTAQSQHLAAHDKQLLANGQQLNAQGKRLTNAEKQAAAAQATADAALAQKTGWTWLDWVVAVMSLLGFAGMIVLIFIKANKSQVVKVESDQADMAKEMKQIEIDDNLESTLDATPVGIAQEIFVTIAGERGLLRFTKSGKGMVTTDQIDTQTQAMKIATLRSTLKRHIGAGRVHTFPYVQEAAA